MAFLVMAGRDAVGILFLASPVIKLGPRDTALGITGGRDLRHYAELSACVAAQPIGWHWNLGKLCALLAATLGDFFTERYGDEMRGITTTSLYGRGSQYNRIYRFLGYTKGYGHEHIGDEQYRAMVHRLRLANIRPSSSRFGEDSSNTRMARIMQYRRLSGDTAVSTFHGNRRGIYYHAAIPPEQRRRVIEDWYVRWGRPRYERTADRTPPYTTGVE